MLLKSDEKVDPRVRRTRKLLQNAFQELIYEKPFSSITVQDIADRAEINRATFYAHYTDKFQLHDEMLVMFFRTHLESHGVFEPQAYCEHKFRNLIYAVCDFQKQTTAAATPADMQFKPDIEALIQSALYEYIFAWVQRLEHVERPDVLAVAISWSIFGAAVQWSRTQTRQKEEVADTIIALFGKSVFTGSLRHKPASNFSPKGWYFYHLSCFSDSFLSEPT